MFLFIYKCKHKKIQSMTGKKLVQMISHNRFIDEAFKEKNARGKKCSFMRSCLKKASRKIRRNKSYKTEWEN